jgi:uncharacterized membrane protein YeaQ/YmgE (transglycosylase-associated protein family)
MSASSTRSTNRSKRTDGAESEGLIAMIGLIVSILVIGLLAGALARLLVPGRQNISVVMTIVLGVVGSFVGGFLGYLIFGKDSAEGFLQPSGILGSVIGAVVVLLIWMSVGRRSSVRNR